MPNTFDLIKTTTLTGSQASITFNNTDFSGYDDLCVLLSTRTNATYPTFVNESNKAVINSDSSTIYAGTRMYHYSNAAGSDPFSANSYLYGAYTANSSSVTNGFGNTMWYIPNINNSNFKKTFLTQGFYTNTSSTLNYSSINGLWWDTPSITSIVFSPLNGSSFVANSSISLYGIKYT